ncbi:MAG: acyl-CoA hydrolase [Candidatus Poriferisodalaceae bacterium]|jgi:acyl-CoA hydrolase
MGETGTTFDWTTAFADRLVTAEAVAARVADGDTVMCSLPEPTAFLLALAQRTDLNKIAVFVPAPRRGGAAAAANPSIEIRAGFITQVLRKAGVSAEVVPLRLQDWAGYARRNQARITVVQTATPLADGTVMPGSVMAGNDELVRRQRGPNDLVFALANPVVPHVPGDHFHVDDFDGIIEIPSRGATPVFDERTPPTDLAPYIGALDDLIPDGATVQAGVGGLSEVCLAALTHKRDLGIHTEVLGPGLVDLMKSGSANGRLKTQHQGQATFTIAQPETFEYIDGNPDCQIIPAQFQLDHMTIAQNRDMRCVNSSLELDLWGQANSEMINGMQHSGVGGQLDFLRGCQLSDTALSILMMPSTAAGGKISRIVPRVATNAVTATRYDTQVVVTEHGVAWLRDASVRQKAERLIAIAHPDHRAELTEEAQRGGLI